MDGRPVGPRGPVGRGSNAAEPGAGRPTPSSLRMRLLTRVVPPFVAAWLALRSLVRWTLRLPRRGGDREHARQAGVPAGRRAVAGRADGQPCRRRRIRCHAHRAEQGRSVIDAAARGHGPCRATRRRHACGGPRADPRRRGGRHGDRPSPCHPVDPGRVGAGRPCGRPQRRSGRGCDRARSLADRHR